VAPILKTRPPAVDFIESPKEFKDKESWVHELGGITLHVGWIWIALACFVLLAVCALLLFRQGFRLPFASFFCWSEFSLPPGYGRATVWPMNRSVVVSSKKRANI